MTKSELRKLRKEAAAAGLDWSGAGQSAGDRNDGPVELGPERRANGKPNNRRADYLDRCARLAYEYDRDF